MNKMEYQKPWAEFIRFENEDVITTSSTPPVGSTCPKEKGEWNRDTDQWCWAKNESKSSCKNNGNEYGGDADLEQYGITTQIFDDLFDEWTE